MQRSGDEAKKCPGLDHPGQSKKESPKHDARKTGEKRPDALDWIILSGTSSRSSRPPDWIIQGQVAAFRPGKDDPGLAACPHKSRARQAALRRALDRVQQARRECW